jgi:hypothetical protein
MDADGGEKGYTKTPGSFVRLDDSRKFPVPRLDAKGNSVRGILACKELASHSDSPTQVRISCSGSAVEL